ncbi:MAG: response regulator transcription factor [Nitrospirales bacterium]
MQKIPYPKSGLAVSCQLTNWHLIGPPPPHKIFLWDRHGTYLDCEYPNPVWGHLLAGPNLRGTTIQQVLPQRQAQTLVSSIRFAITNHHPTTIRLQFTKGNNQFLSLIRIFPLGENVVGWVNDFPVNSSGCSAQNGSKVQIQYIPAFLTPMERKVFELVIQEQASVEMALNLGISGRTLKFHMRNLLDKFQIPTRSQLKVLAHLIFD